MSDIDWSKVNDTAVAALVATKGNVHYPSIEFVAGYHRLGCMIRATSADDGRSLFAPSDCWYLVERPAVWSGEGLPPVGTVCEFDGGPEWVEVEVTYSSEWIVVVRCLKDKEPDTIISGKDVEIAIEHWREDAPRLRPLRTPEQIAAEKRSKAIREIQADLDVPLRIAIRAYEKGYRKEAP